MGQALTGLAIFIFVAGAIMVTLARRTRERMQDAKGDDGDPKPRLQPRTRRQRELVAAMPEPKPMPTIEELVAEEAAATGVNDIPGGEGLDVSLKLRVYWRDEVVRKGCTDGRLEFRISDGVGLEEAETDDVRLVCIRNGSELDLDGMDGPGSTGDGEDAVDEDPAQGLLEPGG